MTAGISSDTLNSLKWIHSSMVEHPAVNRQVAGSSPAESAIKFKNLVQWCSGLTCLPVTEEIASSILVWTAIKIYYNY